MTEIERPFEEPWQARAFAMVLGLHEAGVFTWGEWTETLAAEIATSPGRDYYDSWLAALQRISLAHGFVSAAELDQTQEAWLTAAAHTPHGQPITLDAADHAH